jgi:hypothetical protein
MAAREEDKAMAGLLRRSLAQDAGIGSGEVCPAPEMLAAYFDRALDAEETARYDLHFSRCAVCREQLVAMAHASGDDAAEKKPASAWDWLVGSRWLMPAAAMVVALLLIGGIALRMRKPTAPANEIAMARPDAVPSPSSEPPVISVPAPQAAPPPKVAPPSSKIAPMTSGEYLARRPAEGVLPRMPHADGASRRDELSAVGVAGAKPAIAQPMAPPQAQMNSRLMRPGAVHGAMRAGNANAAAVAPATSADATGTAASAARNTADAPEAAPSSTKKADAQSVESDLNAAVQTEEAKDATVAKTKLPATAEPGRSVTALNLPASKITEAAALAKLQQAQISSNLMNLQIQTPDPKILWMIGGAGSIERSENGGASWKTEYLDTRDLIVAGAAPTVKICWLVGANGTILRTTNGAHWKTINPPAETDFVRVEARDALTAAVMAMDGRKFSTADGGKSWSSVK